MRVTRAILFGATALAAAVGCHPSGENPNNAPPANVAFTRFVNAVNDTGALDFRFVDQIKNSPVGLAVPYRNFTFYGATDPGPRLLRAFFDSVNTSQTITVSTTQVGNDTSLTLTAGTYYTIILLGPSKSAKPKWIVLTDNAKGFDTTWSSVVADTNHIAARVVNLTAADGTGETVTPMMATDTAFTKNNVAFTSLVATAPATASAALGYTSIAAPFDTSKVKFVGVTGTPNTGYVNYPQGAAISYYTAAPVGVPASPIDNLTAIGGLTRGGTVMSIYVFAPVTPGSAAPCSGTVTAGAAPGCSKATTALFRNYGVVFVIDHHPSPNF